MDNGSLGDGILDNTCGTLGSAGEHDVTFHIAPSYFADAQPSISAAM